MPDSFSHESGIIFFVPVGAFVGTGCASAHSAGWDVQTCLWSEELMPCDAGIYAWQELIASSVFCLFFYVRMHVLGL